MFSSTDRQAIRRTAEIVRAVAEGDFEKRIIGISSDPEIAEMENAINLLIDRTDSYLRESQASFDYVRQNKHFRNISERGMVGSFRQAARSVNETLAAIGERHEDFLSLATDLETRLAEVMTSVSQTIQSLRSAAEAVDSNSADADQQCSSVAAGAEQASANMQAVAASAEELTSSIGEINRQAVGSAEIASRAVESAAVMSETMQGLSGASSRINDVVRLINDIADQTNLLALNATIEAARAGEAGRGFAIVAQEVKTLAGQTASATESISDQIGELQDSTASAVKANQDISGAIEEINQSCNAIAAAVTEQSSATGEIARSVEEAAQGTSEVSHAICQVQTTTDATRTTATGVLTASESLDDQERRLNALRSDIDCFLNTLRQTG